MSLPAPRVLSTENPSSEYLWLGSRCHDDDYFFRPFQQVLSMISTKCRENSYTKTDHQPLNFTSHMHSTVLFVCRINTIVGSPTCRVDSSIINILSKITHFSNFQLFAAEYPTKRSLIGFLAFFSSPNLLSLASGWS